MTWKYIHLNETHKLRAHKTTSFFYHACPFCCVFIVVQIKLMNLCTHFMYIFDRISCTLIMYMHVFLSRCQRESEDKDCRLRELERRLQKQQEEHEQLVERNEELEALLGETQNKAKEERECHECEVDSLQRKVRYDSILLLN